MGEYECDRFRTCTSHHITPHHTLQLSHHGRTACSLSVRQSCSLAIGSITLSHAFSSVPIDVDGLRCPRLECALATIEARTRIGTISGTIASEAFGSKQRCG